MQKSSDLDNLNKPASFNYSTLIIIIIVILVVIIVGVAVYRLSNALSAVTQPYIHALGSAALVVDRTLSAPCVGQVDCSGNKTEDQCNNALGCGWSSDNKCNITSGQAVGYVNPISCALGIGSISAIIIGVLIGAATLFGIISKNSTKEVEDISARTAESVEVVAGKIYDKSKSDMVDVIDKFKETNDREPSTKEVEHMEFKVAINNRTKATYDSVKNLSDNKQLIENATKDRATQIEAFNKKLQEEIADPVERTDFIDRCDKATEETKPEIPEPKP